MTQNPEDVNGVDIGKADIVVDFFDHKTIDSNEQAEEVKPKPKPKRTSRKKIS